MKCDNKECKTPKEQLEQQKEGFRCPRCPRSFYCCGKCFTEDEEPHKEVCNLPNSKSKNPYLASKYKEAVACIPNINRLAEIIRTDAYVNRWLACLWDRRVRQHKGTPGWLEIKFSGPEDLKMNIAESVLRKRVENVAIESLFRGSTKPTCANGQFAVIISVDILTENVFFASAVEFSFDRLAPVQKQANSGPVGPSAQPIEKEEVARFVDLSGRIDHLSGLSRRKLYREHVFNIIRKMEMSKKKREEILVSLFKYVKDNVYSIFLLECEGEDEPPFVVECRPTLSVQN